MKARRAIRLSLLAALCLLLGAATTVGVAWTADLHLGTESKTYQSKGQAWNLPKWPTWCEPEVPPHAFCVLESWGRERSAWFSTDSWQVDLYRLGWPLHSMWRGGTSNETMPPDKRGPGAHFVSWRSGIVLVVDPLSWLGQRITSHQIHDLHPLFGSNLAVAVVWPGFAADTALYGLAWYLLIFTPLPLYRAGRRRFRVSRGMCGSCGYDLRGSTGGACPECGTADKATR